MVTCIHCLADLMMAQHKDGCPTPIIEAERDDRVRRLLKLRTR